METQSRKYQVVPLSEGLLDWFVNVAAVNMLVDELERPELVNLESITKLAVKGMKEKTAFVVLDSGEPCGAIGGLLINNLFNPEVVTLAEAFWYVTPEARSGRAGYLLLKALEERAKETAHELTLSILPHSEINIDALERRGFRFEELSFRKKF
jgi:RimJ/RimL family protein N-acetyltransferase